MIKETRRASAICPKSLPSVWLGELLDTVLGRADQGRYDLLPARLAFVSHHRCLAQIHHPLEIRDPPLQARVADRREIRIEIPLAGSARVDSVRQLPAMKLGKVIAHVEGGIEVATGVPVDEVDLLS